MARTPQKIFSEAPALPEPVEPTLPTPPPPDGSVAAALRQLGGPSPSMSGGGARRSARLSPDSHAKFELIPIDSVVPDPDQPRKRMNNIMELRDSLVESGMLQPITVRSVGDRKPKHIMWGERRWRAAKLAGWTHVPAIVRTDVKDAGILMRQLMENSQREDLDPIDEARAIRRFMREHKIATVAEAAKRLGHHTNWASNRLALLDLKQEEQEAVSAGTLSMGAAAHQARVRKGTVRASNVKAKPYPVTTRQASSDPWFNVAHSLASRARAKATRHQCKPLPGGIACGECWEAVIRADALATARFDEAPSDS